MSRANQSPSAALREYLDVMGFMSQRVEQWIPGANVRKDLFGFIDVVAISPEGETYGIQVTTASHVKERIKKIKTECLDAAIMLIAAGWHLEVWGQDSVGWEIENLNLEELIDEN